jgi:hypothetical protein
MKITYEEFSELQEQQLIRNSSQEAISKLRWLNSIVKRKHNKEINKMIEYISNIEKEAIDNIRDMIKGD